MRPGGYPPGRKRHTWVRASAARYPPGRKRHAMALFRVAGTRNMVLLLTVHVASTDDGARERGTSSTCRCDFCTPFHSNASPSTPKGQNFALSSGQPNLRVIGNNDERGVLASRCPSGFVLQVELFARSRKKPFFIRFGSVVSRRSMTCFCKIAGKTLVRFRVSGDAPERSLTTVFIVAYLPWLA